MSELNGQNYSSQEFFYKDICLALSKTNVDPLDCAQMGSTGLTTQSRYYKGARLTLINLSINCWGLDF